MYSSVFHLHTNQKWVFGGFKKKCILELLSFLKKTKHKNNQKKKIPASLSLPSFALPRPMWRPSEVWPRLWRKRSWEPASWSRRPGGFIFLKLWEIKKTKTPQKPQVAGFIRCPFWFIGFSFWAFAVFFLVLLGLWASYVLGEFVVFWCFRLVVG